MTNCYIKQMVLILFLSSLLGCAIDKSETYAAADTDSPSHRDCIFRSSIRGYNVLDESNLILESGPRRSYHVVLQRRAYGLRSSWNIGFKTATSRVCAGFSEIVFEGRLDNESIRIASIQELSPEAREDLEIQFGKRVPDVKIPPSPAEVNGAEVEELDPDANGD